ncbi:MULTISPECIES: phosphatase PAP2 family protein [Sphingobacterium]|uniref:phosphatase PAP2 family protein n=1 Tax=Sphingobacterium TaxID=28453 RepID=UPI0013DCC7B1|nr:MULTISPECIES: phosphatase PAP2 family protein [unclassified Sphingobacterium]
MTVFILTRAQYAFLLLFTILFFRTTISQAQSVSDLSDSTMMHHQSDRTSIYKRWVVPSVLVSYGVVSFAVPQLKQIDVSIRDEVLHEQFRRTWIDDYTQYAPAAVALTLNLCGYSGRNTFKEAFFIYGTSQLLAAAVVVPSKYLIGEQRPDGSNNLSFPSGHAATAFSSAHFMYKEYRDRNFWLSVSGYPFAAFTGIYRVINNKHWASDVVAGAGIGIISTELAYLLYPRFSSLFDGKDKKNSVTVMPFYQQNKAGVSLLRVF